MVGSVVASAADSFWSFLRVDPDDVFADKLKKRVARKPELRLRGLLRLDNTPVQVIHITTKMPRPLSMCGGVWAIFVWDQTGAWEPHNVDSAIPKRFLQLKRPPRSMGSHQISFLNTHRGYMHLIM